jgi:ubiquinone/menaquinone biosynthesis C-methylase UbiE
MDAGQQPEAAGRQAPGGDRLPVYAALSAAYHRAFRRELHQVVKGLPLAAGSRVLDLPCGDGFFTALLARQLDPVGSVVAADLSPAFLRLAARTVGRYTRAAPVEFVRADAYRLPFDDESFDLAWCAQSLITFDDPVAALRELRRVVRPGGQVAVLENDEFHHILVNWPVGIELAVQRAVAAACRARFGSPAKFSPARAARRMLREAGLRPVAKRTYTADRQAPFDRATADFLRRHFARTREFAAARLSAETLRAYDQFTAEDGEQSVFSQPFAEVTCLNTLFLARR